MLQAPLHILAADDDSRMREFYRVTLEHLGHEVVGVVADGRALIEFSLRTQDPIDLIVTDIRMPGLSGLHAACIVAERLESRFLFVSAFQEDLLSLELHLPFDYGYLVKPVRQRDLAAAIPLAANRSSKGRRRRV